MEDFRKDILNISQIISSNLEVDKIILFGSYASGTYNDDSDIDICVITNKNKRKIEILREIRNILFDYISKPLDLLVYRSEEFDERAEKFKSIEREIKEKGELLYG